MSAALRWARPRKSDEFHIFRIPDGGYGAGGQKSLCGEWKYHGVCELMEVHIPLNVPKGDCRKCCRVAAKERAK